MSKSVVGAILVVIICAMGASAAPGKLFPTDLPGSRWVQFNAAGFSNPVSGVIYRTEAAPCCGVAVGGVGTGTIDVDARGVYGFSTIFNPVSAFPPYQKNWRMPRKIPNAQPLLGMSVGGKTWVLADKRFVAGGTYDWCTEPYAFAEWMGKKLITDRVSCPPIENVQPAKEIHYWGHFPVADMEYDTEAPVSVGMRAWAPFLPGDAVGSNMPVMFFEVHLRNTSGQAQQGTIALNFPGPDSQEARGSRFVRRNVDEDFHGVLVSSDGGVQYALGVIGNDKVRVGAGLQDNGQKSTSTGWAKIATELPQPYFCEDKNSPYTIDSSSSAAVDFSLAPGDEKVVKFALAWHAPVFEGANTDLSIVENLHDFGTRWLASKWAGSNNHYTHMYAARFEGALDVARRAALEYDSLQKRVLAWQEVVYSDSKLPGWLRDSLINNLYLIAEDGTWAQAKPPVGDYAFPGGVFGMNECPRGCPDMECIPCDWYGNLPIVYFFPDLNRATLKAFKALQREDGAVPFWLGKMGDLPDFATPSYNWQISLNGTCYVDMVDRLWQATGDDSVLKEFYNSVKKCNTFTMNLKKGPGGVISMPDVGGMEWFEHGEWAGMATHMGGLRLAEIRIMQRMAEKMGDKGYVKQCKAWYADGSKSMEEQMWNGTYYLNFWDKAKGGKKSADIMGYQLDGEWASKFHGLPGVFKADRVKTTLGTIKKCNVALTPNIGAANFTRPDGTAVATPEGMREVEGVSYYGSHAMFCAELLVLAMTYMDAGEKEFGVELARKHWDNLVLKQRHPWDMPNMVRGDNGKRIFGTDYYQGMMLWALPAEIEGKDIAGFCSKDQLVNRVIKAAGQR